MPRDVGKWLDPKRDKRETSHATEDETYRGRRVGSGRHSKTEWGKGVPLTELVYIIWNYTVYTTW